MKEKISDELNIQPEFLKLIDISELNESELTRVKRDIIPSFCYDNSMMSAKRLGMQSIVYGIVVISLEGELTLVEHAWIKSNDGEYFDPTYQVACEKSKLNAGAIYYSVIELDLNEYCKLADDIFGDKISKLCAVDFFTIRNHVDFNRFFTS